MIYINAISYYFPEETLSNDDIIKDYKKYGGNDKTITSEELYLQCGVKKRHVCPLDDTAKNLGNLAAENLFKEFSQHPHFILYRIRIIERFRETDVYFAFTFLFCR